MAAGRKTIAEMTVARKAGRRGTMRGENTDTQEEEEVEDNDEDQE